MQFSDFILIINGFVHVLTPYAVIMNIALVCSITCSTYRHRSFLCVCRYVQIFPEMRKVIGTRLASLKARESASGPGDPEGQALVGFGKFGAMRREDLFLSVEEKHKTYVKEIICHPVTHPGGQLDQLKKYLLKMQEKDCVTADDQTLAQLADKVEQSVSGTVTR